MFRSMLWKYCIQQNRVQQLYPKHNKFTSKRFLTIEAPSVQYMKRHRKNSIAYRMFEGGSPGIIYCPDFQRTMNCHRARALEDYCIENNLNFIR